MVVLAEPRQCRKTTLARELPDEESVNYFDQIEPHDEAFFWATHQGAELDLILRRKGGLFGVECKRTDTPRLTPSIRNAIEDLGLKHVLI
ncbi:MAG: hypothetical protein C0403_17540, partial [Desulfobacterium sp.]|nr:hypothetical protein [Desulfobacterium sp.]